MAIAASGMQNDLARLELISQNVANAATAGYKRQIPVNQAFAGQVDQLLAQPPVTSLQPRSSVIDPMAAPVRASGGSYDLAIEGDGFLEIATPEGVRYTRHGALHLDSSGRLLGAQDMPVMGLSGEMRLANAAFEISPTGEIKQEGRLVGMLKLVHFDKPEQLQPAGNGLYSAGADA